MLKQTINLAWLFIQTHPLLIIALTSGVIILIMGLFYLIRQKPTAISPVDPNFVKKSSIIITSQDIKAIAGDDTITTQLDLARAYIEIGKTILAKKILEHVIQHGNISQQQTAQYLMTNL